MSQLQKTTFICSFRDIHGSDGARISIQLEVLGWCVDTLLVSVSHEHPPNEGDLLSTFNTLVGYRVCTYLLARYHDQIWVLDGAPFPLILRRQEVGCLDWPRFPSMAKF